MNGKIIGKKAGLDLSVNFIVIMILSLLVLGGGFLLMARGSAQWEKEYDRMQETHKNQMLSAMAKTGELVMVYPSTATVQQGDGIIFTLGINNQLGQDQTFGFDVIPAGATAVPNEVKVLYSGVGQNVKSQGTAFSPIRIITSKQYGNAQYVFNVCVYKIPEDANPTLPYMCSPSTKYGEIQKLIVNVK